MASTENSEKIQFYTQQMREKYNQKVEYLYKKNENPNHPQMDAIEAKIKQLDAEIMDLYKKVEALKKENGESPKKSNDKVSTSGISSASDKVNAVSSSSVSSKVNAVSSASINDKANAAVSSSIAAATSASMPSVSDGSITSVINSAVTGVTSTLGEAAASALSAANLGLSSIGDMVKGASSTISDLFSSDSAKEATNAALASTKDDKGAAETDDKIKSVSSSDNNGQPVSFAASGGNGVDSTKNVPQEEDGSWLDSLKESAKDLKEGITSIQETASESISSLKATVGEAVGGTIAQAKELSKTFASAVAPVAGAVTDVLSVGSDIANSIADALPESVGKYVKAGYSSALASASNKILGSKAATVAKLSGLLPGVTDTTNLWTIVGGLATNSQDTLYDENGNVISNKVGNNTPYDINTMFAAASQVCSGVKAPSVFSDNEQKLTYDALLGLAAQKGMPDLITQLANCGVISSDSQPSKFTSTTIGILQGCLDEAAKKGDVNTSAAIVDAMGGQNVADCKKTTAILMGNMSKETTKDPESQKALDKMMGQCGLTKDDMVNTNTPVGKAIDAKTVALTGVTSGNATTGMYDDDYRASLQALAYYSGRY